MDRKPSKGLDERPLICLLWTDLLDLLMVYMDIRPCKGLLLIEDLLKGLQWTEDLLKIFYPPPNLLWVEGHIEVFCG